MSKTLFEWPEWKKEGASPALVSSTRTGKAKFWRGYVRHVGSDWFTQTSYWQVGKDGKKSIETFSAMSKIVPKNVGKKNETSPQEQAADEWRSMCQKQLDKGYEDPHNPRKKEDILPLPMLAQKFSERSDKLIWPVKVQAKYNGQRMLFTGDRGWSRGGKPIIPKVIEHLLFDTDGYTLDGELILPGNLLLQKTMKATKKWRPGVSDTLQYIVYDVVLPDKTFYERWGILQKLFAKSGRPKNVILTTCEDAGDVAQVMTWQKKWTKFGYEGTIIRDNSAGYDVGHRSNQLQKYKDFVDAEFEIVGAKEGVAKFEGSIVYKCVAKNGKEFDVTPEGDMPYRQWLWEDFNKHPKEYVGKFMTVRYQELSAAGAPLFPVGADLREKGDF